MTNAPKIGGIDLRFYENFELEPPNPEANVEQNLDIIARNLQRILMMGWHSNWRSLISWRTIRAVLFARDHELAKSIRGAFQLGLENIYAQLKDSVLTEPQLNQANLFINTCLMYMGYFETSPYETFSIPRYIDNKWELVTHTVTHIELTPTSGFSKIFYSESDRIWALGLEPLDNDKAPSHLIIPGTTYPEGQGFFTALDTDLDPFQTPGAKLYNYGKERLHAWIDKERLKNRDVNVSGTSLGGAISLLLACDKADALARVDVLNPPGIYSLFKRPKVFDAWDKQSKKTVVNVIHQGKDVIGEFGSLHPDWNLYHVQAPEKRNGKNAIADHVINYTGLGANEDDPQGSQFVPIDIEKHNKAHTTRNFVWYTLIRAIFSFLIFKPFRYLILPIIRFINNKVLNTIFAFPLLALTAIFALTVCPALIILVFTGSVYLFSRLFTNSKNNQSRELSDKENSKEKYLKIAAIVVSLLLVVASCVVTFFIPLATAFLIALLIPIAAAICDQIIKLTTPVIHENKEIPGVAHLPYMPRHEHLCAYKNTSEATFTYKELLEYYNYRQIEIKHYPTLNGSGKSSGLFIVKEANIWGKEEEVIKSKAQILEECKKPECANKLVTRVASKAKLAEMKNFLFFKNHAEFNSSLNLHKNYENYISGKERTKCNIG